MTNSGPLLSTEFGPYRCLRVMGDGINHKLYHALELETGHLIALRVIPLNPSQNDLKQKTKALLAELQSIRSPFAVPVLDFGIDDDVIFIASPIMAGGSLEARIKRYHQNRQSKPEQRIAWPSLGSSLYLIQRIGRALEDIHSAGYVHGLVDPINIMFNKVGDAYLGEMGVAQLTKIIFRLGDTNSFYVSRYAAPELWHGNRPQPASDQYSLACLAYELFTGEPPFGGTSIYTLMKQHTEDAAMPPNYIHSDLPESLAIPFWRAMAKPMHERYASVSQFIMDISDALADVKLSNSAFFTEPIQP